jgi:hypothetical protein
MWTGALGHRDVAAEARAQLYILFERTDRRKIVVVDDSQLFPSAALRSDVAGRIPGRQSRQDLTVVFGDHVSYLPAFRRRHVPRVNPAARLEVRRVGRVEG